MQKQTMKLNNDDLKKAWPVAVGGLIALGIVYAFGPAALALAIIAAVGVWGYIQKVFRQREEVARAATYGNAVAPFFVFSNHPDEPTEEVYTRAAHIREQLRVSGNPYADALPIVAQPFSPFLGAGNPLGPLPPGVSFAHYQYMCAVTINTELGKWRTDAQRILSAPDYQVFLTGVLPAPQSVNP